MPLAIGVSGYLELTAEGMAPGLFVLPGPLSVELAELVGSRPAVLIATSSEGGAESLLRAQSMPGTATLLVTAFDCEGHGAPGVRLEVGTTAVPFSIINGLPILNERTTTDYATAGFINVSPGLVVVSGYRADTDELVSRDAVPVRSGWDTLVTMLPERGLRP